MTTKSHTPGPWKRGGCYGHLQDEITDSDEVKCVAVVWTRKFDRAPNAGYMIAVADPEREANARLIAAAPDLLFALIAAYDHLDYCGFGGDKWERECAKAEGLEETIRAAIHAAQGDSPPQDQSKGLGGGST